MSESLIVEGVASDEHENLYMCDPKCRCVHVLSLEGQLSQTIVLVRYSDHLRTPYVSDWNKHAVCVFNKQGKFVALFILDPTRVSFGILVV